MVDLFNWHGEIGITHEPIFPPGGLHAALYCQSFTTLHFLQHSKMFVLVSKILGDFESPILAAVIDNEDFGRIGLNFKKVKYLL